MILTALAAIAAPPESELVWNLTVAGKPVGTRTVTVKMLPGDQGTRRVLESFTAVQGNVGPIPLDFRQRFTAHAVGSEPASFHSVVDQGGDASEIQGRFSSMGWTVTTNVGGRLRTADYAPGRIDLSTADLFDPESRIGLQHADTVRLLSTETGEVLQGSVTRLGSSEVRVAGTPVSVEGYSWTSPEGKSAFWFSPEGYLVKYELKSFGVTLAGLLDAAPPAGIDDFAVRTRAPVVERIPL